MTTTCPPLTDGSLMLRRPSLEDVKARLAAGNDVEIQRMYGVDSADLIPITPEQATSWVSYHLEQDHSWFIDIDGALRGQIFLHSLNKTDKRASLAMGLLRGDDLGKGYGTRALRLMLSHAFGVMDLHRLGLRVIEYNKRAIAAYTKVGFQIEGREREAARVGNAWYDDIMMGILAQNYVDVKTA